MPYADPEKRREVKRKYKAKVRADPAKAAHARELDNAAQRRRYASDPSYREKKIALALEDAAKTPHETKRARAWRSKLKRMYGITPEDYEAMLEAQGRACALCRTSDKGKQRTFDVDHCHETNKVRGLLCRRCNLLLGYARDSAVTLRAAAEYIDAHAAPSAGGLI